MTESTGTPFAIYFSYPTEIEHSELLTSSLLNELHSFEKLAVINFNLLSHKLLNLNNHWSCFKSFENIVSEFHSCRIPTSWKLKQSPFKYNKMRWGKNHKRGTECLQLYSIQVSNILQFRDIDKSSVKWKKRYWWLICFRFVCSLSLVTKPQ